MRVAVTLGGTDAGRSGLGTYVKALLPRLARRLEASGGELVALGTRRELAAYEPSLGSVRRLALPALCDKPGPGALWHLLAAGPRARRAGADVLLLPAANRRLTVRAPLPTVAVVHDLAQLHVPGKFDALRMAYLRQVVVRALARASQLVAVSETTRRDLVQALGCPPERVRVVANGVDVDRFRPMDPGDPRIAEARRAAGLDGPYLLYPARLEHPGKNHLRLLRAFARSARASGHLLALSGGDWGAGERIQEEAARLGIAKRVRLLGFVADEQMPGLIAGADAVAMVGLCEGFGLPALEALAAGRPVFAARAGALPEVLGPLASYAAPEDEEALRTALEAALSDSARERAAAEGPAWAAARSWDGAADGLLQACLQARAA